MPTDRNLLLSFSTLAVIGLFPDVGSAYVLSRLPGGLGQYLGLAGTRLRAADLLHCGLATHLVPRERYEGCVALCGLCYFCFFVLCFVFFLYCGFDCTFLLLYAVCLRLCGVLRIFRGGGLAYT